MESCSSGFSGAHNPAWARIQTPRYPMLFPYPWASFVVSAKSLFLVIAGAAVVLLFVALGFMALGAAAFGEFPPPKRPRFPLPEELAVFPYGVFYAPKPADKSGKERPDTAEAVETSTAASMLN